MAPGVVLGENWVVVSFQTAAEHELIEERPVTEGKDAECAKETYRHHSQNGFDMSHIPATTRNHIEAQGFLGFDDRTLTQINYWLRLSPAICMVWAAIGTALNSASILWALVPFALLGAVLPGHPFDVLYTYGFRYLVHGPRLPRYPLPRRFACLMATIMVAVSAWGFQTGNLVLGHIVGWLLVAAALVNVSTGFCIPSFVYGLIFGKPSACERRETSR